MPKTPKVLTKTLYCYTFPKTADWVRKQAKKKKVAYSMLVTMILEKARRDGLSLK